MLTGQKKGSIYIGREWKKQKRKTGSNRLIHTWMVRRGLKYLSRGGVRMTIEDKINELENLILKLAFICQNLQTQIELLSKTIR